MGSKQSKVSSKKKKPSGVTIPLNMVVSSDIKDEPKVAGLSNENNAAIAISEPAAVPTTLIHEVITPARAPSPPAISPPAAQLPPGFISPGPLIMIRDHYKQNLEIFASGVMTRAERGEAPILRRTVDGIECRIVKVWYNPTGEKPQRVVVIEKGDVEGYGGRKEWEVVFLDGEQAREAERETEVGWNLE